MPEKRKTCYNCVHYIPELDICECDGEEIPMMVALYRQELECCVLEEDGGTL